MFIVGPKLNEPMPGLRNEEDSECQCAEDEEDGEVVD